MALPSIARIAMKPRFLIQFSVAIADDRSENKKKQTATGLVKKNEREAICNPLSPLTLLTSFELKPDSSVARTTYRPYGLKLNEPE